MAKPTETLPGEPLRSRDPLLVRLGGLLGFECDMMVALSTIYNAKGAKGAKGTRRGWSHGEWGWVC